jgi:putative NADPH-quinone reductase
MKEHRHGISYCRVSGLRKSLANKTIIEKLKDSMADLEIRSLSRMYPYFNIYVKAEQEVLVRNQTTIFQFPLYRNSMPAFLKHWFDLVFEYPLHTISTVIN